MNNKKTGRRSSDKELELEKQKKRKASVVDEITISIPTESSEKRRGKKPIEEDVYDSE